MNNQIEIKLTRFIGIGCLCTSLILLPGYLGDLVNLSKFLSLGIFSFALLGFIPYFNNKKLFLEKRLFLLISIFISLAFVVSIFSPSRLTNNFYGAYGRNTGFLTYLSLCIFMFFASQIKSKTNIIVILRFLLLTAFITNLYGIITWTYKDLIMWNNIYGSFLGFLGNPNFASSFLGIAFLTFFLFYSQNNVKKLAFIVILHILTLISIIKTDSFQGLMLVVSCSVLFLYVYILKNKKLNKSVKIFFTSAGMVLSTISVFGFFHIGPLASVLFQRTTDFRLSYWNAAITTAKNHPFFGIGMDTFSNWYSIYRSLPAATDKPGPNTYTNAAHNVYLDILAYGGFPLFIVFLAIFGYITLIGLKTVRNSEGFESLSTVLFVIWIAYNLQAIISINQIGIAIWGWVIGGLIIANSNASLESSQKFVKAGKREKSFSFVPVGIVTSFMGIIGFCIYFPPVLADHTFLEAKKSGQLEKVLEVVNSSYFNPVTDDKLSKVIIVLAENGYMNEAKQVSNKFIELEPMNKEAWRLVYELPNSTASEKETAKAKLMFLDPLNPRWKNLK